jgi:hypothetical protein
MLLTFSSLSFAGCNYIAETRTSTFYMEISDGGCGDDGTQIQYTNIFGKNGEPDYSSIKKYPFYKECTLSQTKDGNDTGFICSKNGHTPLAGTTYKKVKHGKYLCQLPGEGDIYIQSYRYICVNGCSRPLAPKYLEQSGSIACD